MTQKISLKPQIGKQVLQSTAKCMADYDIVGGFKIKTDTEADEVIQLSKLDAKVSAKNRPLFLHILHVMKATYAMFKSCRT